MEIQPFLEGEAAIRAVRRAGPTEVRVKRKEPKACTKSRNAHHLNMTRKIIGWTV